MPDAIADAGLGPAPPALPGPASPERSLIDDIVIDRGLVYRVDHRLRTCRRHSLPLAEAHRPDRRCGA